MMAPIVVPIVTPIVTPIVVPIGSEVKTINSNSDQVSLAIMTISGTLNPSSSQTVLP